MQLAGRLAILTAAVVLLASCDTGTSNLNVDNRSSETFVVQVGDKVFVVPPTRQMTVLDWGMVRPDVPIRLLDALCVPVSGVPDGEHVGTIVIEASAAVSFRRDDPGTADPAQVSTFCAIAAPSASPLPT